MAELSRSPPLNYSSCTAGPYCNLASPFGYDQVLLCYIRKTYEPESDRRDLLAIKVKSEIFTEKKDLAVVNNYRKFEEIIFTNNKDMSV